MGERDRSSWSVRRTRGRAAVAVRCRVRHTGDVIQRVGAKRWKQRSAETDDGGRLHGVVFRAPVWPRILAAVLVTVLAAACGEEPESAPESRSAGSPSADPSPQAPLPKDQLYEGTGVVVDNPGEKPIICLSGVEETAPPRCDPGTKLRRWSWEGMTFDELGGSRWGTFTVQGTYIVGVFTLKGEPEVPEPYVRGDGDDESSVPCPHEGRWPAPDPERTSSEDRAAAIRAARAQPDHAGAWIGDHVVLVLAFTGDAERHEAEAREHWGGPLCIWIMEHSNRELGQIQRDVSDGKWTEDFGVETTWSDRDVTTGIVMIGVIASTPEFEAELERRYGPGVVEVHPALHPVEGERG